MLTAVLTFIDAPNGPVVVGSVDARTIADEVACRRLLRKITNQVAGLPVILRCQLGETFLFSGPDYLRRFAVDPVVDVLPSLPFVEESSSWAA